MHTRYICVLILAWIKSLTADNSVAVNAVEPRQCMLRKMNINQQ